MKKCVKTNAHFQHKMLRWKKKEKELSIRRSEQWILPVKSCKRWMYIITDLSCSSRGDMARNYTEITFSLQIIWKWRSGLLAEALYPYREKPNNLIMISRRHFYCLRGICTRQLAMSYGAESLEISVIIYTIHWYSLNSDKTQGSSVHIGSYDRICH